MDKQTGYEERGAQTLTDDQTKAKCLELIDELRIKIAEETSPITGFLMMLSTEEPCKNKDCGRPHEEHTMNAFRTSCAIQANMIPSFHRAMVQTLKDAAEESIQAIITEAFLGIVKPKGTA